MNRILLRILMPALLPVTGPALWAEQNLVEDFKQFLASPPIVSKMIFSYETSEPIAKKSSLYKINSTLYLLRWQPNAFLLTEGKDIGELNGSQLPTRYLVSSFESNRWYASDSIVSHSYASTTNSNAITTTASNLQPIVRGMIGLGIHVLVPGTLSWSDATNFTGETDFPGQGLVQGQITGISHGRVSEIRFSSSRSPQVSFLVRYEYLDSQLPPFLPSHIHQFVDFIKKPKPAEQQPLTFVLRGIETNSSPLSIHSFNPLSILESNAVAPIFEIRYTNQTGYVNVAGKWEPVRKYSRFSVYDILAFSPAILSKYHRFSAYLILVFITAIVLFSIIIVARLSVP